MKKITAAKNPYSFKFFLILCLLMAGAASAQTIRYVKQGGTGDGSSWANALGNINWATQSSQSGDEVWVAKGTYQPAQYQSFFMKPGVKIYGGFPDNMDWAGMADRNWTGNETILQGNEGNVIFNNGNPLINAVLDGFIITGGDIGIANYTSSATFRNLRLIGNTNSGFKGFDSQDLLLENVTSTGNTSFTGGGIYLNNCNNINIVNSTISHNGASYHTGGIYCLDSTVNLTNVVIWSNSGTFGAAVMGREGSALSFINCSIVSNQSSSGGGAALFDNSSASFSNTIIWNNASAGTAVQYNQSTVSFSHCIVQDSGGSANWNGGFGTDDGNNSAASPMFADMVGGGFSLAIASPAVNAGDSSLFPDAENATDRGGDARVYGGQIDIGAYEQSVATMGSIRYVKQGAWGDGSSWYNASGNLKNMIDNAEPGQEIWVEQGTYYTPSNQSFYLKEGLKIYGGFAYNTNESTLENRKPGIHNTVLVGNGSRIFDNNGITGASVLDGFIMTDGSNVDNGAGMRNINASPTIRNCSFRYNTANNWGGAMYNLNSSPTLTNCLFHNNQSAGGGATFDHGSSNVIYTNVTFAYNLSTANGGAIHTYDGPQTKVNNCIFWGNDAYENGDQVYSLGSAITSKNCLIAIDEWNVGGTFNEENTIFVDPLFTDPGNYNYSLQPNSLAINAGNAALFANAATSKDFNGNSRVDNTAIDLGPYEAPYPGVIRYVTQDGTGNGDSWATASGDLQQTLDEAIANDQIWVAAGNYSQPQGESFSMKEGVKIYGGFPAGDNTADMADRNPALHQTGIFGNGSRVFSNTGLTNATVLDGFTISAGFEVANGAGMLNTNASPLINNCIFSNNIANEKGGAIYNDNSSPIVTNSLFYDNESVEGGAIFEYLSGNSQYYSVTFSQNTAQKGGAIYNDSAELQIHNCILWGNTAAEGDQLYTVNTVTTTTYCLITNDADNVVGNLFTENNIAGDPLFTNAAANDFTLTAASPAFNAGNNNYTGGNATDLKGNVRIFANLADIGAYEITSPLLKRYVKQGATGAGSSWQDASGNLQQIINGSLSGVEIWVAEGTYQPEDGQSFSMRDGATIYGGFPADDNNADMAVRSPKDHPTILSGNNNRVFNNYNITNTAILDGFTITGGIAGGNGGGMHNDLASPLVRNCIFSNNTASQWGGGMYNVNSSPIVSNTLFHDNYANGAAGASFDHGSSSVQFINVTFAENTTGGNGGAIHTYQGASTSIFNCILWGNSAGNGGQQVLSADAGIIARNTVIPDGPGNIEGPFDGQDINAIDPLFTDAANNDFTLSLYSPAVNTGDAYYFTDAATATDLAGNPRLYSAAIDPGAYESQSEGACGTPTVWNGSSWSNGIPFDDSFTAVINGDYDSAIEGDITACSLYVTGGDISVADGSNFLIKGGVYVSGGSLTFENNANLIQADDVDNTGEITYKRNSSALYNYDYTIWSSPVTGSQTLKEFSSGTLDERFYVYNTTLNAYSNYLSLSGIFGGNPDEETFDLARGYLIRMPDGSPEDTATVFEGSFTGVPNNGNVSIALGTGGNRYNAVGNPYPSPIGIKQFLEDNEDNLDNGTLYFWRKRNGSAETTYATVTLAGYVASSQDSDTGDGQFLIADVDNWVINPGQGFFVKAADGATQLNFDNTMRRVSNNGQFFRMAQNGVTPPPPPDAPDMSNLWLNITSATGDFGQAAIAYSNATTLGLDYGYDGRFLNDGLTAIYTIADDTKLSVQARPAFEDTDEVPLGYKATVAGNFTISLDHVTGLFEDGQDIYLKDNVLGITHDLTNSSYTFASDLGTVTDRFHVVYAAALGTVIHDFDANSIVIYQKDKMIMVNSGTATMKDIAIYDIRGRLVYTGKDINASETVISDLNAQQQVLIVKVTTVEGATASKKIIF
jgi:predicted outer membrane repeat protein